MRYCPGSAQILTRNVNVFLCVDYIVIWMRPDI